MIEGEHSAKEIIKFVLVIIGIILGSVVLMQVFGLNTFEGWMRCFMGLFFVVFASFKFIGYKIFTLMFAGYDVVAKRAMSYSRLYPFIELSLGVLYLANLIPTGRDLITVAISAIGSIGVYKEVTKRSGMHCACLGNVIKLPLSTVSLVEDIGMGLMALAMLVLR